MGPTGANILILQICVIFGVLFTLSDAYGSGAPPSACAGAQPIHTTAGNLVQPLNPAGNPYSFNLAVSEYVPGEDLQVTIAEASGGMVNGFFLQARRTDTDAAVGTFQNPLPSGAQIRQCTSAADSVTHTNPSGKTGLTFTWRAPAAGTGQVQFVGAVAIDHDNFYGGMMSSMLQEASSATNTTGSATNTTSSAVTMNPTNNADGADMTTRVMMDMTTADAIVLSPGFGVLLLALIAGVLQLVV